MNGSESLSSILANTLDIIGNSDKKTESHEISAASQLLSERKKLKRSIDFEDFVPFAPVKKTVPTSQLLNQISVSTVEPPCTWNSGAAPVMTSKQLNKKGYNKVLKKSKKKGEDYKDRHSEKVVSKLTKKAYFNKLKSV